MTLQDAINSLKPDDLRRLTYAFENQFSEAVFLDDGYVLSVFSNIDSVEEQGPWKLSRAPQRERPQ